MQQILTTIYQILRNNPALQAMITDVYQFPMEDRVYPYIQLEVIESKPSNGLPPGHGHQNITLDVHILSAYRGVKEVNTIADLVQNLLETTLILPRPLAEGLPASTLILKLLSRTITGQQDTKMQRIRMGTLRFVGICRF
jgi:hypothetical protein